MGNGQSLCPGELRGPGSFLSCKSFRFLEAFFFLCLFLILAFLISSGATAGFDQTVREFVHRYSSSQGAVAMSDISFLASSALLVPTVIVAVVALALCSERRNALLLGLTMLGEVSLEHGLKQLFHRARPAPFFGIPLPDSFAYPSGHALASVCFYGTVATIICRRYMKRSWPRAAVWAAAVLMIGLVGLSRIYLGVHYPTDVIGGYLVGTAWVVFATIFVGMGQGRCVEATPGR